MQSSSYFLQPISPNVSFGFNARYFPLVGAIVSSVSILLSYYIAVTADPPHVKPFPQTDITHTGIHFPQYIVLRIGINSTYQGLLVAPVLFCITFEILKNYLQIQYFKIRGQYTNKLRNVGIISIISCVGLMLSTSSISDGGDMNWTLHTIGATSFFILAMYIITICSGIYRELYLSNKEIQQFYGGIWIDLGAIVEWVATFYIIIWMSTLYWDMNDMQMKLEKIRRDQNDE